MVRVIAAVAFSVLNHFRGAWIALAVVPFPGSLYPGNGPSSVGAADAVSAHDAMMTILALGIEIAFFILIPIYLRARRRKELRSAIRIRYDSRCEPAGAIGKVLPAVPAAAMKESAPKVTPLRLVSRSRLSA